MANTAMGQTSVISSIHCQDSEHGIADSDWLNVQVWPLRLKDVLMR